MTFFSTVKTIFHSLPLQVYTETPLHTAAGLGHKDCMQLLLDHGADVRSQFGKRRLTALHLGKINDVQ